MTLNLISDFLNMVMTYNRGSEEIIKTYFDLYVLKCKNLGVSALDSSSFFNLKPFF